MSDVKLTADFSGAIRKTAALKQLPRAHKRVATEWAAGTVKELKREAAAMQKSVSAVHKKTGQLARNVGMLIGAGAGTWTVAVGTGIANTQSVKYALLQDKGGTTHPNVTKRMRRWAWFAFGKTGDEKYRGLALTKKDKLTVRVPATHWFTGVIDEREPILREMMSPAHVLKVAEGMASAGGIK